MRPYFNCRSLTLVLGVVVWLGACSAYGIAQPNPVVYVAWAISILIIGAYAFSLSQEAAFPYDCWDGVLLAVMLLLFLPFYTAFLYNVPYPIHPDEISLTQYMHILAEDPKVDLLGLGWYGFQPNGAFLVLGHAAKAIGGITVWNLRLLNGVLGLVTLLFSYLFFRLIIHRRAAVAAACLVGSQHSVIAISRMGMRDNTPLLLEMASMTVLFRGFQTGSSFLSYLGGVILGLTFYTYFPARIIVFIWFLFLAISSLPLGWAGIKKHGKLGLICLAGFFLVAAPVLISGVKAARSKSLSEVSKYPGEQLLITEAGRTHQRDIFQLKDNQEAVKRNIVQGLTMFNKRIPDQAWMYFNPGYGFLDPVSGILLWMGIAWMLIKRKESKEYIILGSFFFLWAVFVFMVTMAPNYHRLLLIVPFIAYSVVVALDQIAGTISAGVKRWKPGWGDALGHSLVYLIVGGIVLWNLQMYSRYALDGIASGHDYGGTARFVESRRNLKRYTFYIVADAQTYPYYLWGGAETWMYWITAFTHHAQEVHALPPATFFSKLGAPPFTVFMNAWLWRREAAAFHRTYPHIKTEAIQTDAYRNLLAVDVY